MENTQSPRSTKPSVQNDNEKPSSKYKKLGIINLLLGIFCIPEIFLTLILFLAAFYAYIPHPLELIFPIIIILGIINFFIGMKLLKKSTINKEKYFLFSIISIVSAVLIIIIPQLILLISIILSPPKMNFTFPNLIEPSITPTINTSDTSTPTEIGTSWKTYTNTKYGYSIQYPVERFTPCGNENFSLKDGKMIDCNFPAGEEGPPFFNIQVNPSARNYRETLFIKCYSVKREPIKIASASATMFSSIQTQDKTCNTNEIAYAPNNHEINILLNHNNQTYLFTIKEEAYGDEIITVRNQILSTFRFAN